MCAFRILPFFVIAVLVVGSPAPARASDLALDFTGGAAFNPLTSSSGTSGWSFTVNSTITVESLGFWDEGANGLNSSHEVGLWTAAGTLLSSTTIGNSSTQIASTSSDGRWLFESVTPIDLGPGDYVLGAFFAAFDPDFARFDTARTTISEITFGTSRYVTTPGTLPFPSESVPRDGGYGPNLLVASPTIPEPATLVMLSIGGIAAFGTLGYRRRN
jgi:hypothetical protein